MDKANLMLRGHYIEYIASISHLFLCGSLNARYRLFIYIDITEYSEFSQKDFSFVIEVNCLRPLRRAAQPKCQRSPARLMLLRPRAKPRARVPSAACAYTVSAPYDARRGRRH